MENNLEGEHTGFLRHIPGKQVRGILDRTWETPGVEVVWEAAVTQLAMTYICIWQTTVAHWLVLQPIF